MSAGEQISREAMIVKRIQAAGLPLPSAVIFAKSGDTIAVAFQHGSHMDTIEGCGTTDEAAADDVIRQFRLARRHG